MGPLGRSWLDPSGSRFRRVCNLAFSFETFQLTFSRYYKPCGYIILRKLRKLIPLRARHSDNEAQTMRSSRTARCDSSNVLNPYSEHPGPAILRLTVSVKEAITYGIGRIQAEFMDLKQFARHPVNELLQPHCTPESVGMDWHLTHEFEVPDLEATAQPSTMSVDFIFSADRQTIESWHRLDSRIGNSQPSTADAKRLQLTYKIQLPEALWKVDERSIIARAEAPNASFTGHQEHKKTTVPVEQSTVTVTAVTGSRSASTISRMHAESASSVKKENEGKISPEATTLFLQCRDPRLVCRRLCQSPGRKTV